MASARSDADHVQERRADGNAGRRRAEDPAVGLDTATRFCIRARSQAERAALGAAFCVSPGGPLTLLRRSSLRSPRGKAPLPAGARGVPLCHRKATFEESRPVARDFPNQTIFPGIRQIVRIQCPFDRPHGLDRRAAHARVRDTAFCLGRSHALRCRYPPIARARSTRTIYEKCGPRGSRHRPSSQAPCNGSSRRPHGRRSAR